MTALPLMAAPEPVGPNGVQFSVDWLAFTVKTGVAESVISVLIEVLGEEWRRWDAIRGGERSERRKGPHGALLEANWREKWTHVQLKGLSCRAVGLDALMHLHDVLSIRFGDAYRVKRVDLTWDDMRKRVTPRMLRDLFWDPELQRKRPEVICRAKAGHAYEDDSVKGGGSYRVGERSSNRMLRVYDKAAQSGGVVDSIRWELECKGRVAGAAMEAMAQPYENRSAAALRYLVGFLDFREVLRGVASGKRARCRWWAELVEDAKVAIVGPPERGGLEEWRATFCRQNSSGFRLLVTLHGGDLGAAAAELFEATDRDNPRHEAWRRELLRKLRGEGSGPGGAAA